MVSILKDLITGVRNFMAFPEQAPGPFVPDYTDVRKARALLTALKLPTELVLDILEYAQYWPSLTWSTPPGDLTTAAVRVPHHSQARLCIDVPVATNHVFSDMFPTETAVEIKAIEFRIKSQDQGWTSEHTHGTYITSSWLEVSILRQNTDENIDDPPSISLDGSYIDPRDLQEELAPHGQMLVKRPEHLEDGPQGGEGGLAWYLQGNCVANPLTTYNVLWTRDGFEGNEGTGNGEGFLEALEKGDRLLVWARAKVSHALLGQGRLLILSVSWMDM
jgi:hypothetical protein